LVVHSDPESSFVKSADRVGWGSGWCRLKGLNFRPSVYKIEHPSRLPFASMGTGQALFVSFAFRQLGFVTTALRFFGKSNQAGMSSSLSSGITPLRLRDGNTRTE
jgi:hypothetical protein